MEGGQAGEGDGLVGYFGNLLRGELPHGLGGVAGPQFAGGDGRAGCDDGSGGDDGVGADGGAVHNLRRGADPHSVLDGGGVDDGPRPDRHVVADGRRVVALNFRHVDDRPIADAAVGPNRDGVDVPAQSCAVPYAGIGTEGDVAHDVGRRCDEGGRLANGRGHPVDGHYPRGGDQSLGVLGHLHGRAHGVQGLAQGASGPRYRRYRTCAEARHGSARGSSQR